MGDNVNTQPAGAQPTEPGKDKYFVLLSQEDANYVTLSPARGKACANCRWFKPDGDYYNYESHAASCHLVSSWPESILATGYCDRHEAKQVEDLKPEPLEVIIVEPEADEEMEMRSAKPNALKRVFGAMKDALFGGDDAGFEMFEVAGKTYWLARHTNNFEDLEGEILSEKSHDEYIARLDMGLVPMPDLWLLHIPGTKHGQALKVMRDGHIVFAVGEFDDTPLAKSLQKYYRRHRKNIELSHGFMHPSWAFKDGVYESYNTFEISTLPTEVAMGANPYTTFEEIVAMTVSAEQRAWMENVIGKEQTEAILATNEKHNKALETAGAKFKDFAQLAQDNDKPGDERIGALAKMMLEMVEGYNNSIKELGVLKEKAGKLDGLQTAYDDLAAKHKTLEAAHSTLKAQVEADAREAPRRASNSGETLLTKEQAQKLLEEQPAEIDPFFPPDMQKPKAAQP